MTLIDDLAEYDGKSTSILEAIAESYRGSPEALSLSVRLVTASDENVAAGATWLMRRWLEAGRRLSSEDVVELGRRLSEVNGPWARLHICQAVDLIDIGSHVAPSFFDFLEEASESPRPFLRAWGTDGMVRLARNHARYHEAAERALERAVTDEAASVRARARRILAE